jgi:hypothetical protein
VTVELETRRRTLPVSRSFSSKSPFCHINLSSKAGGQCDQMGPNFFRLGQNNKKSCKFPLHMSESIKFEMLVVKIMQIFLKQNYFALFSNYVGSTCFGQ